MSDEPHAVVKLLVARMESHPEEFKSDVRGRWGDVVDEVSAWGNETDRAAMNAKLRDIRLDEAHADALEELLNGPERRRQQEADRQYERQLIMQKARNTTQQAYAQTAAQQYAQQYAQTDGTFTPGIRGKSLTGSILDNYANLTRTGITNTTNAANALQLGSEKLDETLLKKLKGLLK
jgi:hypothetical protein